MVRWLMAILALFTIISVSQPTVVEAKSRPKKTKKKVDAKNNDIIKSLGSLKWGDTKDEVIKKLRDDEMKDLRNDAALKKDRVRMQKEMSKVRDRSKRFADTYTVLEGESNLDVSVIGDEFITNNRESFLRVSDSRTQRYYFFYRDRLYKYVVAYNRSYLDGVDFEGFVAATIEKYGRPADAIYDEEGEEDVLMSVVWDSPDAVLVVKNKLQFFGTVTMTFAEPTTYQSWKSIKDRRIESARADQKVSAEVKNLIQDGDVSGSGSSVVASIVGNTKVDIKNVVPKSKEDIEKEKEEAEKAAEAKKSKKKKKKKKSRRKKSKKDFSDLKTKSGGGLIIY